jgi:hypothetical protein
VCFACAPWTSKNHVAGFVDELQLTQLSNRPFIDGWLKAEIKLLEGFHERQMRQLRPGSQ